LKIYSQLEKSKDPLDQKVLRFMTINGSRYDLVDELRPFVGNEPAPPGRSLYPRDATQAEIEKYVAAHPEQKADVYNEQSLLRRDGGKLKSSGLPRGVRGISEASSGRLAGSCEAERRCGVCKVFAAARGRFADDDYFASDIGWLDLQDPKFDLILAPYETYLDNLLGVRTSYGAAVLSATKRRARSWRFFKIRR